MNISDHFTLEELTRTEVRGLAEQNKAEAVEFIPNLKRVADELLEPIRSMLHNVPIHIHSGFRCYDLNEAIGGSPRSQHMLGMAADFSIEDTPLLDALHIIAASDIRFNQLLIENECLHISLPYENTVLGEVAYWNAGEKEIIRARVVS